MKASSDNSQSNNTKIEWSHDLGEKFIQGFRTPKPTFHLENQVRHAAGKIRDIVKSVRNVRVTKSDSIGYKQK